MKRFIATFLFVYTILSCAGIVLGVGVLGLSALSAMFGVALRTLILYAMLTAAVVALLSCIAYTVMERRKGR